MKKTLPKPAKPLKEGELSEEEKKRITQEYEEKIASTTSHRQKKKLEVMMMKVLGYDLEKVCCGLGLFCAWFCMF